MGYADTTCILSGVVMFDQHSDVIPRSYRWAKYAKVVYKNGKVSKEGVQDGAQIWQNKNNKNDFIVPYDGSKKTSKGIVFTSKSVDMLVKMTTQKQRANIVNMLIEKDPWGRIVSSYHPGFKYVQTADFNNPGELNKAWGGGNKWKTWYNWDNAKQRVQQVIHTLIESSNEKQLNNEKLKKKKSRSKQLNNEKLQKACTGKTATQGGMNVEELKQMCIKLGISSDGTRKQLLSRLCKKRSEKKESGKKRKSKKKSKKKKYSTYDDVKKQIRRSARRNKSMNEEVKRAWNNVCKSGAYASQGGLNTQELRSMAKYLDKDSNGTRKTLLNRVCIMSLA